MLPCHCHSCMRWRGVGDRRRGHCSPCPAHLLGPVGFRVSLHRGHPGTVHAWGPLVWHSWDGQHACMCYRLGLVAGSLALAMAAVLVSGAWFCVDCKHACVLTHQVAVNAWCKFGAFVVLLRECWPVAACWLVKLAAGVLLWGTPGKKYKE